MAFILFFLILLFLSGKILCNTGRLRLQYVCTAVILFPYDLVLCNSPQISYMVVISCLFFLSFLRHKEYKRIQIDKRIIFFLYLLFILHICVGIFDSRLPLFTGIWKGGIRFIKMFYLIVIGMLSYEKNFNYLKFMKYITNLSILIGLYGLVTFATRIDPFAQLIHQVSGIESDFSIDGRTRICSFFFNSHDLGLNASILALFCITTYQYWRNSSIRKKMICAIPLLFIMIVLSGSRSSLIAFAIGIAFFLLDFSRMKRMIALGSAFAVLIYLFLFHTEMGHNIQTIFKPGESEGSSIEMRLTQLAGSLYFFENNPVWGNGFDYFSEEINSLQEWKGILFGAESFLFVLLIEYGSVLGISIIFYFIVLFRKISKLSLPLFATARPIYVCFLINIFITGGGPSKWTFSFILIGLLLSMNYNQLYSNSLIQKK